ncbi:sodium-translocating pyrophosphatase [Candidatus Woesearchaeota archaeon]|jgi:K(+)-stimulated pyrophosphate-energized sodium pump|nr:sodium-translocating pyrophosphatase [Candidatus Woesearchaeota archaeon]MBT4150610.1 sodium-translocating pyrophosphatase [Candidatus Woesearchaeota archaeon]MBT4247828.1 sodium-translocating pyrophosphatase [Candidatus Woesearchaeota archaeon]MBT4434252.1 sodium-translocating pyrophosphatase [Candidatus Woesearchaeota archaeon]MBT7331827.1 sodium-translocating pyrophosphatase [Candidatus Woesearchaeota archaeon]
MIEVSTIAIIISLVALAYAAYLSFRILAVKAGSEKMQHIANAIREGAMAYMARQYKTIAIFAVIITGLLYWLFSFPIAAGFLLGAILSGFSGYVGMSISVRANVRTAETAKIGAKEALDVAFKGGSVTGMAVVGFALLAVSLFYSIYKDPALLIGLGFGASLISLFARVGGGIFTKAADVGADLVGKIEKGIPEDDPRNPATIADNVGDNVGDCAGMGADLYETYVVTILAAMLLATIPSVSSTISMAVELPLILGSIAVISSIIGMWFVKLGKSGNIMGALYKGLIVSGVLSAIGFYFAVAYTGNSLNLFLATLVGLVITVLINVVTEYYTSTKYSPVKMIAKASETGAGTNLIMGLAIGLQSTIIPVLIIAAGIIAAFMLSGIYGVAIAAVAMLSLTGVIIALDSYGPITDNAGGIAEMAGLDKDVRKTTDELDAVGNTTKAVTKGYAVGSAALGALALFAAFTQEIGLLKEGIVYLITDPLVMVGLLLGALLPFAFSSVLMTAVGSTAHKVVIEVRRQFKEIKGIMTGEEQPEYGKCVDIVTKAAIKNMIIPAVIAVVAPLLVGLILGIKALGGLLIGVILSGLLLALFMSNAGAAWDNAKKYIEDGNHGGKGSDAHKAAVVGDTVGDPFKDTAGPALNALIKVINTLAIVFAPLFVMYGLTLI